MRKNVFSRYFATFFFLVRSDISRFGRPATACWCIGIAVEMGRRFLIFLIFENFKSLRTPEFGHGNRYGAANSFAGTVMRCSGRTNMRLDLQSVRDRPLDTAGVGKNPKMCRICTQSAPSQHCAAPEKAIFEISGLAEK